MYRFRRSVGLTAAAVTLIALTGVIAVGNPASAAISRDGGGCNTTAASARVGHFSGIVRPVAVGAACAPGVVGGDPHNSGGSPPLIWHSGPMMGTRDNADKVVLTPIYWAPSGYSFATNYEGLLNRYLKDAAAASDKSTNVFSTLWEYSGSNGYINYRFVRGTPIIDTNAFPTSGGCVATPGPVYSDSSGYTTCVDDAQETAEINSVAGSNPRDLGHMYVLFLPKHVESCFTAAGTQCTINPNPGTSAYCAYHSEFNGNTVYANMPFPIYGSATGYSCTDENLGGGIQSPNHNVDGDVEISPLSHEVSEAITDPDTSSGWYDSNGFENGDDCAYLYGQLRGTAGTYYNQVINKHHYLTQEEFSNHDFNIGDGGCLQQYKPAAAPAVTKVAPNKGSTAGGQGVTITGTTFGGTTAVHFGSATAPSVTIVDPTHLRVTAPAHAAGTVNVTVTNAAGQSTVVVADRYTYS